MSAPAPRQRECFYLVDEQQSARLAQFRDALRGLSQLSHNPHQEVGDPRIAALDGPHLAAIFDLLDDHLGLVLNGYTERTHWTGPAPTAKPTPRMRAER